MEKHVFRAYDIRGIYGKEIFAQDAVKVGAGLGSFVDGDTLVVGHDARLSSPLMAKAAISGINSCGKDVKFIGLASTPEVFFATYTLGVAGGLGVGASHNPPQYCGFKFAKPDGTEYADDVLKRLYSVMEKGPYLSAGWDRVGKVEEVGVREAYVQNIVSKVLSKKKLKLVVDVMNGCGGAGGEVLRKLGHDVEVLNGTPDGNFGGKTPEPTEGNLKELSREVVARKADFGCAFDGDGDRCVFLDEKGKIIRADAVIMLMAQHEFARGKNPVVVATVNCSQRLENFVRKKGGRVIWSKVGRVFIDKLVAETGACLAGEESSHFWFSEFYPFSDGPLAAAKFSEMVGELGAPLSLEVSTLGLGVEAKGKVAVTESAKWKVMEAVVRELKKEGESVDIDGIKLVKDDYWVIVRASNTEPILKINVEAETGERAELVLAKYRKKIEELAGKL